MLISWYKTPSNKTWLASIMKLCCWGFIMGFYCKIWLKQFYCMFYYTDSLYRFYCRILSGKLYCVDYIIEFYQFYHIFYRNSIKHFIIWIPICKFYYADSIIWTLLYKFHCADTIVRTLSHRLYCALYGIFYHMSFFARIPFYRLFCGFYYANSIM